MVYYNIYFIFENLAYVHSYKVTMVNTVRIGSHTDVGGVYYFISKRVVNNSLAQ